MWRSARLASIGTLLLIAGRLTAQEPSLQTVLDRASAYVEEFNRQYSAVVAEEEYVQDMAGYVREQPRGGHQVLRSDLLLVRLPDVDRYVDFRDVFEVNGAPVRDRADRLSRLFLEPGVGAGRFQQILTESARYNLGRNERILRNVNTPTLALHFLERRQRSRFSFRRAADRNVALGGRDAESAGRPLFSVATELWVVEYREVVAGTVIRTPEGRDTPSRGRFWIEPSTGRVLMTELLVANEGLRTTIDVSYQSEDTIGLLVPVQMRERYEGTNLVLTGTANYSNFRQFSVSVGEKRQGVGSRE